MKTLTLIQILIVLLTIPAFGQKKIVVLQDTKGNLYTLYDDGTWKQTGTERKCDVQANWNKLRTGMTEAQVRKLLGEPDRTATTLAGNSVVWTYPNGGTVEFWLRKVLYPYGLREWTPP